MAERKWWYLLGWILLLAVWQAVSLCVSPLFLPAPTAVLGALWQVIREPNFAYHAGVTLLRAGIGFGGAMVIGVAVGVLMGAWPAARALLHPWLMMSTSTPPVVWAVLLLIWFGFGNTTPIASIIVTTFPLVAAHVAEGVGGVDSGLLEMARVFAVPRSSQVKYVIFPHVAERVFTAARLAMGFVWRVLVMAEFMGSTDGLGYLLSWARQNMETERVLAYLSIFVVFGLMADAAMRYAYGRVTPWRRHIVGVRRG